MRCKKPPLLKGGGNREVDGRIVVKQPIPPSTSWLSPLAPKGAVKAYLDVLKELYRTANDTNEI